MNIAYLDKPCDRCGNKRKIDRIWTETVQNFTGSVKVKHQQIVCSNKDCQEKFEKAYSDELLKKEKLRAKRETKPLAKN
ncbi:MAG TPA: hypothetical protein VF189_04790 [Patescibacteria group bacterium]